jgi:hypothetical protein
MAYGCQASLDHAKAKIECFSELAIEMNKAVGLTPAERMLLRDLAEAVAYLHDAVRYLKDGVP